MNTHESDHPPPTPAQRILLFFTGTKEPELKSPLPVLAQLVRLVFFVAALGWTVIALLALFDPGDLSPIQTISLIIMGALMAIAMGASFISGRKQFRESSDRTGSSDTR